MKTSPATTTTESRQLTMESLSLPPDLLWNGKIEPTSPPSSELFSITEPSGNWLYDDNFANEITLITEDILELKPGLNFTEELFNGEDLVVELYNLKDEHWNDPKLQSPTQLLDYQIGTLIPQPNLLSKVQNSFDISNAFGASNFDTAILTQLTPPHSPPQNSASPAFSTTPPVTTPAESPNNLNEVLQETSLFITAAGSSVHTANDSPSVQSLPFAAWNDDIERESKLVDEIVNCRAQELPDWNDEGSESQSSYSTKSLAESITDEEWTPAGSSYSSVGSSPMRYTGEEPISAASATTPKKRTRPYGRGIEDRKIRKKEQNKNAATRYRQKKKLEMECVLGEEHVLTERNKELRSLLADRKREAKYLKTLIREFYQQKK